MHSKSDYIEIMINDLEKDIEKVFKSLQNKYQNNLESMRSGAFAFDCL